MVSGKSDADRNRDRAFGFDEQNVGRTKAAADSSPRHRDSSSSPPRLPRWERRVRDAKKAHRPRLRDWGRDRFGVEGSRASAAFEALNWECADRNGTRGIARETRDDLTPQEFWDHYERRRLPVVVSGIPSHEGWRAGERWSLEQLDRR